MWHSAVGAKARPKAEGSGKRSREVLFVCMYDVPLDLGLKTRIQTFIDTLIRLLLYPLNPDCLIHSGSVATPSF